jgi:hypothetical protein
MAQFDSAAVDTNLVRPLMLQLQKDLDRSLEAIGRLKNSAIPGTH